MAVDNRQAFSAIYKSLNDFKDSLRKRLDEIGAEADAIDRENGTYHDVTGRLRSSNKHEVTDDLTLRIYNDAPYAAEVEARGEKVRTDGILYAEEQVRRLLK